MKVFIGAHPDDIEIGCGAYLLSLREKSFTEHCTAITLSSGSSNENIEIHTKRRAFCIKNFEFLDLKFYKILNHNALNFHNEYDKIKNDLILISKELFKSNDLIEVYFHSADNHEDHKIVNKIVKEVFRPFDVYALYEYEIPQANIYNQPGDDFNIYFDFIEKMAREKQELLNNYKDISLFERNDARDINFTLKWNKIQGERFGFDYTERFKLIFKNKRN